MTRGTAPEERKPRVTYDLNALIREVVREDSTGDIRVVAKCVRDRIPTEALAEVLDQCLPRYVYDVARGRGAPARSASRTVANEGGGATVTTLLQAQPRVCGARTSRAAAVRQWWAARLEEQVSVGPSTFKAVGDCTAADLQYAAAVRSGLAEANAAAARSFEQLADTLLAAGAATVRELPTALLTEFFEGRLGA